MIDLGREIEALSARLAAFTDPACSGDLLTLLRLLYEIGRNDLPLGRLFEGHVDALQIVSRYGDPAQVAGAHSAARMGARFGVWNAEFAAEPLRLNGHTLDGGKSFASGAGILSHALVTADSEGGRQLILVDLARTPPDIDRSWWRVIGMQRSETHVVRWSNTPILPANLIGKPGDYAREPWFGGGALRFAAVQAGGIAALVDHARDHLVKTGRACDPIQASRLATLYALATAAAGAVALAARSWFDEDDDTRLALVAAARAAVAAEADRALALAQQAVGLQGMFVDHPLSAAIADLSVYLRQPAPDAQVARVGAAVADGVLTPCL